MQFKRLVMASVCALALQGAAFAQAADDVYVDLSVLNNLQPGDSLFVETQPLFPVIRSTVLLNKLFGSFLLSLKLLISLQLYRFSPSRVPIHIIPRSSI